MRPRFWSSLTDSCGAAQRSPPSRSPTRWPRRRPSLEHVVVVRRLGTLATRMQRGRATSGTTTSPSRSRRTAATHDTDADDPFMLIYTSGTTGRPKGTVHVQGGFPIKSTQDMAHCFDVGPSRPPALVHRHRLDDGTVGDLRRADDRRHAGAVRGRSRPSRPRPSVVGGGTPPCQRSRRRTHGGARADAARRRARARPRSLQSCASSAPAASPGTTIPGSGSSSTSGAGAVRSSTTAAGPR